MTYIIKWKKLTFYKFASHPKIFRFLLWQCLTGNQPYDPKTIDPKCCGLKTCLSMDVYVYVCVYVYVYAYVYACMCTCKCVCMCMYVYGRDHSLMLDWELIHWVPDNEKKLFVDLNQEAKQTNERKRTQRKTEKVKDPQKFRKKNLKEKKKQI